MLKLVTGCALAVLLSTAAFAADANGEWLRDDGVTKVRFSPCGAALCGSISWLKDPNGPAKVGQQVFFDMAPNGANTWAGKAFNPDDGKTYAGKMSLSENKLTTAGCVLGGLICKSFVWTRVH